MRRCCIALLGVVLLTVPLGCGGASDSGKPQVSYTQQIQLAQKETSPDVRAKKLTEIGFGQGKAGDDYGAEETFRLAAKACDEITDPATQTRRLAVLGEAYGRLDSRSDGRRTLDRALAAADKVESVEVQADVLARIARSQKEVGDVEPAVKTLQKAEGLADKLDDVYGKILVLTNVAYAFGKLDNQTEVDRVLGKGLELTATMADTQQQCEAIAEIAATQFDIGRKDDATATFAKAVTVAKGIEDPRVHALTLVDVAEKLAKAKDYKQAHELLDQADLLAHKIPEPDMQRMTVEKVRTVEATVPEPE